MSMRQKLNKFAYEKMGIDNGEMDMHFTFSGRRYRIKQFCPIWIILQSVIITGIGLATYIAVVETILIMQTIGG